MDTSMISIYIDMFLLNFEHSTYYILYYYSIWLHFYGKMCINIPTSWRDLFYKLLWVENPPGNVEAQRWGGPSGGRRVDTFFADGRNEGKSTFTVLVETIM